MSERGTLPAGERFRRWVAQTYGLHFDDNRLQFLENLATQYSAAAGMTSADYLLSLELGASAETLERIAVDITVPETYFFRHMEQLQAFSDVVLRGSLQAAHTTTLRVLSVGCASGEEPYALAMLARDLSPDSTLRLQITGFDLNADMLRKAAAGVYTAWSLRETPPAMQSRWFRRQNHSYVLDESIRACVDFHQVNLAVDEAGRWRPDSYDVIFCRNVLMYFTRDCARAIVARITGALVPQGYLFLGHADTLHGLSHDYRLLKHNDAFYYRRLTATLPAAEQRGSAEERRTPGTGRRLAPRRAPARLPVAAGSPPPTLAIAREHLKHERFVAALDALDGLPPAQQRDAGVLQLRAALLMQRGSIDAAQAMSLAILETDARHAGAHHLLALCCDHSSDIDAAITHDCQAAQMDPQFAMPRLHLGLMAKRAGRHKAAARDLGAALPLLAQESDERILLFGGGFGRDALITMCRTELRSTGVER